MPEPRYRIPRDLRWSCHACAKCCSSGLELGPVEPDVITQLLDSDIRQQWGPAAHGFHETRTGEDGSAYHVLRQNDGRCVFLRDDDLCAVHALLGPDAKPGFCREFPYLFVDDPKGTVAVIRPACGSFPKSFLDGDKVGPDLDAIASVRRATPRYTWSPDSVQILPGLAVSTGNWLALEDPVLDGIAQNPEPPSMSVARIREALVSVTGRSLPPASPARYEQALSAILHAFVALLTEVVEQDTGGQPHQTRFVQASLERMKLAQQRTPAPWDETSIAYLNLCLRSQLLSKGFSAWGGLPEGLGVFLVGAEVAWRAGDGTVESLGEHLAEWIRLRDHRMGSALLRRAAEATRDLFLHAGAA
jgi:Fe-S-cluster containining protein